MLSLNTLHVRSKMAEVAQHHLERVQLNYDLANKILAAIDEIDDAAMRDFALEDVRHLRDEGQRHMDRARQLSAMLQKMIDFDAAKPGSDSVN